MGTIDNYFSSNSNKIVISPEALQQLNEKISQNQALELAVLKNLNTILNSNSAFKDYELEMWLKNLSLPFNIQSSREENGKFIIDKRPITKIEPNSLRIMTKSCGIIQFRVPPNTIKTAIKSMEPSAQYYVITETTFYNGMNYIDIAFPIFENFFLHQRRKTIFLCTSEEVKKRVELLAKEEIFGPSVQDLISYGMEKEKAAELHNEMMLFAVKIKEGEQERISGLHDFINIHVFENNHIRVNNAEITRKTGMDYFTVKEDKKDLGYIDLIKWDPVIIEEKFSLNEPGKDTEFGVYFFDPSTGFDANRLTSSFIVWIGNGKGMAVDPLTNLPQYLDRKRINRNDMEYIFLTHAHSDHDDGILEQVLSGKVIKILTTKIIMESFIRKVKAITAWDEAQIRKLIQFVELKPGKDLPLNDKTSIRIDYAFHSIPTCRFVVTYSDPIKNIKKSLSYSGDTNFNKEYIDKLVSEGKMTPERAASILGFIWDSDIVIHDAGGDIHTNVEQLLKLPEEIQKKIIAIHVPKLPEGSPIRQASKGQEINLVPADKIEQYRRLARQIDEVVLFKKLSMEQKLEIIENTQKERFKEGEVVIQKGDIAKKFYIIHTGEIEIDASKDKKIYLGKGDYFGEMAFFKYIKIRNAAVIAKTDTELLSLSEPLFMKYKNQILDTFQNIIEIRPLLANISFFKMLLEREINILSTYFSQKRYDKGETIIKYGEIGDRFYIVKYGLLKVMVSDKNGAQKEINQIGTGSPFGETALIEKTKRMADIIVISDYADIVMIDNDTFQEIVSEYPSIALGLEELKQSYKQITKERTL